MRLGQSGPSSVRPLPRHGEAGLSHPRGARLDCQASASLETAKVASLVAALAPGRGEGPARAQSVSVAVPGWHLAADRAQALRHRRRSASWACQRSSDAFCPALDLGPVAVVAEPTAESMEEQARGPRPLMSLDHASEDPVLARVNRILELADLPGLAPHQLADPAMSVSERADTEQPHWSRGKRGAVGAQEPGRARDPALVVDAAARTTASYPARSSTSSTGRASTWAPASASLVAIRSATPLVDPCPVA